MLRRTCAAVCVLTTTALLLAGCGSSGAHAAATVKVADVPKVGQVLVDGTGQALYMFAPDARRGVTCMAACALVWPPLDSSAVPKAGAGINPALLGRDKEPDGHQVVTYNGWPLYTYAADGQTHQATGQALDLNGGYWYVMTPAGKPLVPAGQPAPIS